jgi:hypothetical protein
VIIVSPTKIRWTNSSCPDLYHQQPFIIGHVLNNPVSVSICRSIILFPRYETRNRSRQIKMCSSETINATPRSYKYLFVINYIIWRSVFIEFAGFFFDRTWLNTPILTIPPYVHMNYWLPTQENLSCLFVPINMRLHYHLENYSEANVRFGKFTSKMYYYI